MTRTAVRVATLLLFALLLSSSAWGQAREPELRGEVERLRLERERLQDRMIERERAFDQVKRRMLEEQQAAQREVARTARDARLEQARLRARIRDLELEVQRLGGEAVPAPADPLERRLDEATLSLDLDGRSWSEVQEALGQQLLGQGLTVELASEELGALHVSLRTGRLGLRLLLELLSANTRDEFGAWVDLTWRRDGDTILIERAR